MEKKDYYAAYFDGACEPVNPKGNLGIGAFILNPERKRIFELSKYILAKELNFETSNNVAEYMGIIAIFEYLIKNNLQKEKIIIGGDSKLVINQMLFLWNCNGGVYVQYYKKAKELRKQFDNLNLVWIPREQNEQADILSKASMIKNNCEFRIQTQ